MEMFKKKKFQTSPWTNPIREGLDLDHGVSLPTPHLIMCATGFTYFIVATY